MSFVRNIVQGKIQEAAPALVVVAGGATLTAAQCLGNNIIETTTGALVLPTAALLVAADKSLSIGSIIRVVIVPVNAGTVVSVSVTGATGIAAKSVLAAPTGKSLVAVIRIKNITVGAEAADLYIMG